MRLTAQIIRRAILRAFVGITVLLLISALIVRAEYGSIGGILK